MPIGHILGLNYLFRNVCTVRRLGRSGSTVLQNRKQVCLQSSLIHSLKQRLANFLYSPLKQVGYS